MREALLSLEAVVSGVLEEVKGTVELKKCPHCGSDVMLCRLNGLTFAAYEFSIVCPGCGLETKITCNPSANCCFDMATAVNEIIEKWNRRDGNG